MQFLPWSENRILEVHLELDAKGANPIKPTRAFTPALGRTKPDINGEGAQAGIITCLDDVCPTIQPTLQKLDN